MTILKNGRILFFVGSVLSPLTRRVSNAAPLWGWIVFRLLLAAWLGGIVVSLALISTLWNSPTDLVDTVSTNSNFGPPGKFYINQGSDLTTTVQIAPETVLVRLSHYWPPLLGANCSMASAGECVAHMASGERWQDWVGRAAACPPEWPFGTAVTLPGGEQFLCLDRGGKITTGADGIPWIDILVEHPPVPFGTLIGVQVDYPKP